MTASVLLRKSSLLRALGFAATLPAVMDAKADEGGVSFWTPGQFGSLAAVPTAPGWSLPLFYYSVSGSAGTERAFVIGGRVTAGLEADVDLLFAFPTYTFAQPVLGGQAALGIGMAAGHNRVSADVSITGPGGATVQQRRTDSVTGGSDLYMLGTLKWNAGVHNYLAYTMAGAPVGDYEVGRLANLGTNHWSVDAGGGYTYFDPAKGHEASIVVGATYSFENKDTQYRNGIDAHVEWAASQFLDESVHVGVVGYYLYQVTGDSGPGAVLGDFKSRVGGVGPQVGRFFPMAGQKAYLNLKGYWEFDAKHRIEGWSVAHALDSARRRAVGRCQLPRHVDQRL